MKQVQYDPRTAQSKLADRIADLELQLANEQAAKQAIVKYAEGLEQKLAEYEEADSAE